jgi:hypothetical protein
MVGRIPDIESIVVSTLNNSTIITDLIGNDNVSTELPPDPVLPRIRVTLSGGNPIGRHWIKEARVMVEAWANSKTEALTLIVEAAYVLETELDGTQLTEGVINSFEQNTGISWMPDPINNTPRYMLGFVAIMHENN